jgi:hypothetical protein
LKAEINAMYDRVFDVALSFSGKNRTEARTLARAIQQRNLTVFYDEWFKADIWGEELTQLLPQLYLNAKLCIPLISRDYAEGPYTKREFQAVLEKELRSGVVAMLPIRLDDTQMPGLSTARAFLDYNAESCDAIAEMVAARVAKLGGQKETPALVDGFAQPMVGRYVTLNHYYRDPPQEAYTLVDDEIVTLLRSELTPTFSERRVVLAHEVAIFLRFTARISIGAPYDIWRSGDSVFLSCLPGTCISMTDHGRPSTLEFRELPSGHFGLHSVWRTKDPRYSCIPPRDWLPAVSGLTANRVVPNMEREVAIRILEGRKADFGFPLTSGQPHAEKLCGWIQEEPPNDYMEWGRDPTLISGKFEPTYSIFDTETEISVYCAYLQGAWTSQAFNALIDTLAAYLPGRHRLQVISRGEARLIVLLLEEPGDTAGLDEAYDLTFVAFARMQAASRGVAVPPLNTRCSIRPPARSKTDQFFALCSDLCKDESIDISDSADLEQTRYRKLRQQYWCERERRYYDAVPFPTRKAIVQFIERIESGRK